MEDGRQWNLVSCFVLSFMLNRVILDSHTQICWCSSIAAKISVEPSQSTLDSLKKTRKQAVLSPSSECRLSRVGATNGTKRWQDSDHKHLASQNYVFFSIIVWILTRVLSSCHSSNLECRGTLNIKWCSKCKNRPVAYLYLSLLKRQND